MTDRPYPLSQAFVLDALTRPPEKVEGGWQCRMCEMVIKTHAGLGPHYTKHRREVGLLPQRPKGYTRKKTASASPPAVMPEVEESVVTDISASEAVTGILSAARRDHLVPVRLLPAVYDLIEHVEHVLKELRRLS